MSKKNEFQILNSEVRFAGKAENLISTLKRNKRSFYLRDTTFMTTVIYNNTEITFPKRNTQFPLNQLWIFRTVKANAEKLAREIDAGKVEFVMPEKQPTNKTNLKYDDSYGELTGTDINSAYWTIARNLGIISEQTYTKAQGDDSKVTRLAALAILGRDMAFQHYEGGDLKKDRRIVTGAKALQNFYKAIRYTCYWHMNNLAELLGADFDAYRTDCIYYRDTPENRKLVYDYLDGYGFYYKQLEFEEEENSEKPL